MTRHSQTLTACYMTAPAVTLHLDMEPVSTDFLLPDGSARFLVGGHIGPVYEASADWPNQKNVDRRPG